MTEHPIVALKAELQGDPEQAWGWHCNIAMPIMDATGVSHELANQAAAHVMQHLFGVDITTHPFYDHGKSGAQQYAEMRIVADLEEDAEIERGHPAPPSHGPQSIGQSQ